MPFDFCVFCFLFIRFAQLFNLYAEWWKRANIRGGKKHAEKYYLKALDLDSNNAYFNTNLAELLTLTSPHEQKRVERHYQIALKAYPNCANTHYSYSWFLQHKIGNHVQSLDHCNKAIKWEKNSNSQYHYLRAQILQSVNKINKAADEALVALKQNEKDNLLSSVDEKFAKTISENRIEHMHVNSSIEKVDTASRNIRDFGCDYDPFQWQSDDFRKQLKAFISGMDIKDLSVPAVATKLLDYATELNSQCVASASVAATAGTRSEASAEYQQTIYDDDYTNHHNNNDNSGNNYSYHHNQHTYTNLSNNNINDIGNLEEQKLPYFGNEAESVESIPTINSQIASVSNQDSVGGTRYISNPIGTENENKSGGDGYNNDNLFGRNSGHGSNLNDGAVHGRRIPPSVNTSVMQTNRDTVLGKSTCSKSSTSSEDLGE